MTLVIYNFQIASVKLTTAPISLSICTAYQGPHGTFSPNVVFFCFVLFLMLNIEIPCSSTWLQADGVLPAGSVAFLPHPRASGKEIPKWKQARPFCVQSSCPEPFFCFRQLSQVLGEQCWWKSLYGMWHTETFFFKQNKQISPNKWTGFDECLLL